MARLSKAQEELAWWYLMNFKNNTNKDIAELMGLSVSEVSHTLDKREDKKMNRINKAINKRYDRFKVSERFRLKQRGKMEIQNREGNKDLARVRNKPGKNGNGGMDN